jgi:hypothetical protein
LAVPEAVTDSNKSRAARYRLEVYLSPEQGRRLETAAEDRGDTKGGLARRIIDEWLRREKETLRCE